MTRERILILIGIIAVGVTVLAVALVLGEKGTASPDVTTTPDPSITIAPGPAPTLSPTSTPGPDDSHGNDPGGGEDHNHGEPPEDCSGPVACNGDETIVRNTQEDLDAAAAVRHIVEPFVAEWATINSSESSESRTARLMSAGANAEAASTMSVLARANTTQVGLTAVTTPRKVQRLLFLTREDGLLKFQASLDVEATYMQPDDSGSRHIAGGAVFVYLTDSGTVARVTERFPSIEGMR